MKYTLKVELEVEIEFLNIDELDEDAKEEIEDIDLVFKISKLKNDHIRFKLVNFDKVGKTKVSWTVTKPTECDLGKWLLEQENSGASFSKHENWKKLKQNHEKNTIHLGC